MITSNYKNLQLAIADDLGDRQDLLAPLADIPGLSSPIVRAIQSAITKWEKENFFFNRYRADTPLAGPVQAFTTQKGQEFYSATDWPTLPKLAIIKKVWVLISSNRYTLNPRTPQYIDDISVNPAVVSNPVDYAYDTQEFRFYPIPDGVYPVGIWGTLIAPPLVADGDTNIWTNEAYDLIRAEAKLQIARDTLHDDQLEQAAYRAIYGTPGNPYDRGFLYALKAQGTRLEGNSRVKPSHF